MGFYAVSGLINALTALAAGVFVIVRHEDDARRITFAGLVFSIAVWGFLYFFWQLAASDQAASYLARALFLGCYFIPSCFFHHATTLANQNHRARTALLIKIGYLLSVVFVVLIPTPLIVRGTVAQPGFSHYPDPGPWFNLYTAFFFFYVGYGIRLLYRVHQAGGRQVRKQFGILLFGTAIAFMGGATNFFLLYDIPIPPIGNVVVPFYILVATYVIMRYQFMDIQVVITRTSLLVATYVIVLGVPFLIGWFARPRLEEWFGIRWWLVPLGLCTVLATVGPSTYAYLRRQAEAGLLREQRRYRRTLQLASRGMTQVRNVERLTNLITRLVSRTVGMTHASLFLWDERHQRYVLKASHGPKKLSPQSRYGLELEHPLIQWLQRNPRPLVSSEAAPILDQEITREVARFEATLIIPGMMEHRLIGFLALGPKRSGARYSNDDLHAFSTLANEAAVAVENATSYEELLRVNEQLKVASERLLVQERLAAAGQFATGMAHEIKNPLSAIKTFAQYLPEKYDDPVFREKFFRIVQAEIDRINDLVKALSDFAKPAPLDLQPIHLASVLDDTLSLLGPQFMKHMVDVKKSFNDNGLCINADRQQLKQIVLNLLLNSIEAMENGGRIQLATQLGENVITLRISDTGCGIEPRQLDLVWDPFFTTKERGMGLGMAIVKGVVERHGGKITISSTPGKGTTVELSLPIARG